MKVLKIKKVFIGLFAIVASITLCVYNSTGPVISTTAHSENVRDYEHLQSISDYMINTTATSTLSPSKLFDQECDRNGEWQSISNHSFFKRRSVVYFADASMLNMNYMKLSTRQHNFTLQVVLFRHNKIIARFNVSQTSSRRIWDAAEYYFGALTGYLTDLSMDSDTLSLYQMKVLVGDSVSGQQADSYMDVTIKNLNTSSIEKQGFLLITKCFYMTYKDYYFTMKWWIEMTRRAGINKILLCDQRIDKHPAFDELYKRNEDLIEVTRLNCIPNLQVNPKYSAFKYLKEYDQMEWRADSNKMENMNMILLNEAYINNMDKYKYITHFDNDELIMVNHVSDYFTTTGLREHVNKINSMSYSLQERRQSVHSVLENTQCKRYTPSSSSGQDDSTKSFGNVLHNYLEEIKVKSEVKQNDTRSYHFTQSYFIQQALADQIFEQLDETLNEIDILGYETRPFSIYLNVTDYNRPNDGPHAFSVTIKSYRELRYAVNLLIVYKTYVKPYLIKNAAFLATQIQDFDRFFVFVGDMNAYMNGKTLFNTQSAFDMTIHFVENYVDQNQLLNGYGPSTFFIPNDRARLSHFRRVLTFSYKELPIENIIFDLNYFNCYFKPTMEKFLKEQR